MDSQVAGDHGQEADAPRLEWGASVKGIVLILAQVLPVMAVVSLFPALPRLVEHFEGQPNAGLLVPMIVTVPSLCIALLSPLAGWITDRYGRRITLNAALALYAVSGVVPVFFDDLPLIVASRALLGVAEACIVTVASTLIADYFGEGRYRWLAWQAALGSVSGTLLLAVGGWLADMSWRGPFTIYFAVFPLLLVSLIYINEPVGTAASGRKLPKSFPWREAAIIGAVTITASIIYYVEPMHVALALESNGAGSTTRIGLIQAATSLAYIAGAFVYKRLYEQPIGVLLGIAFALIGVGLLGIGLSRSYVTIALWATVQQLGGGMIIPALLGWAQSQLPYEQRGRGMGIWATFFFAGLFVCPPITSAISAQAGGLQPAFVAWGIVTLVLLIPMLAFMRRPASAR